MGDFVQRLFTLPVVVDAVAAVIMGGAIWWKYFKVDWEAANKLVAEERKKVFARGQEQLSKGIETMSVGDVTVGVANSYVGANSFGPLATGLAALSQQPGFGWLK